LNVPYHDQFEESFNEIESLADQLKLLKEHTFIFCRNINEFLNHCRKVCQNFGGIYNDDPKYARQKSINGEILKTTEKVQKQISEEIESIQRFLSDSVESLEKVMELVSKTYYNRTKLLKKKIRIELIIKNIKDKDSLSVSQKRNIYDNHLKLDETKDKLETFDIILTADLPRLEDGLRKISRVLVSEIIFFQLRIQYLIYTSAESLITFEKAADLRADVITDCFLRRHAHCLTKLNRLALIQKANVIQSSQHYLALYDYEAEQNGDLSLAKGDLIKLLVAEGNWWKGLRIKDGVVGVFPSNYVAKKYDI